MANCKGMAVTSAIVARYRSGWSKSQIAQRLGINRETVARHVGLALEAQASVPAADSKPAIPPAGIEGAKPAIPRAGESGGVAVPLVLLVALDRGAHLVPQEVNVPLDRFPGGLPFRP